MVQRSIEAFSQDRKLTNRLRSMVIRDEAFERHEIPDEMRDEIHGAVTAVNNELNEFVQQIWRGAGLCEYFTTSPARGHVLHIDERTQAVLIGSSGPFVRFAVESEPYTFLAALFSTSVEEGVELIGIDATETEAVSLIQTVSDALLRENGPRFHPREAASRAADSAFG